jgi:hypothetical protein
VPAEVTQAIKAKLVAAENKHFEVQQAQFEARMEAQRTAAAAKQAQAVPA